MSDYDVNTIACHIPLAGGTSVYPLFQNHEYNGRIKILDAHAWGGGNGTVVMTLVQLGTGGTSIGGTLGTTSGSAFAAITEGASGTPVIHHFSIDDSVILATEWVGIKFGAGTPGTATEVIVTYVKGV